MAHLDSAERNNGKVPRTRTSKTPKTISRKRSPDKAHRVSNPTGRIKSPAVSYTARGRN
jgi:hypothetical protein